MDENILYDDGLMIPEEKPEPPKTYKITLADGTVLSNLSLNGNNFVSKVPVTEDMFEYNLSPVKIYDGFTTEVHENMKLIQIAKYGSEYYFILADISKDELERTKIRADIDYLAMMTDNELL